MRKRPKLVAAGLTETACGTGQVSPTMTRSSTGSRVDASPFGHT